MSSIQKQGVSSFIDQVERLDLSDGGLGELTCTVGIIDYQDEGFCVLGSSSFHLVRTSRCLQFDIRVFDDANRASKCRMSKSLDTRSYLELKNNNSTVSSCPSPGSGSKT